MPNLSLSVECVGFVCSYDSVTHKSKVELPGNGFLWVHGELTAYRHVRLIGRGSTQLFGRRPGVLLHSVPGGGGCPLRFEAYV